MPLKINVGLTKKVGLPNYGSAGASCHVEFELDTHQILQDAQALHGSIEIAYVTCRQAIQDELNRQLSPSVPHVEDVSDFPAPAETQKTAGESETTTPATLGVVQANPLASQRQLNYVHYLAHGISGLTPRRLEILAATVCGKKLAHLTTADASRLIDTLKQIDAGNLDLSGVPREVPA